MTDQPSAPRITPIPQESFAMNIFGTLAHNEPLSKGFMRLGGHLLQGGVLPARTRELIILRVGWNCGSEYEFGQHTAIGRTAGLSEQEIAGLADVGTPSWSPDDQALLRFTDELCANNVVREATWENLHRTFSDGEMLELLVLAGFYRLVSGLLNSVPVALEPGTAGWPDGAVPLRRAPRQES